MCASSLQFIIFERLNGFFSDNIKNEIAIELKIVSTEKCNEIITELFDEDNATSLFCIELPKQY